MHPVIIAFFLGLAPGAALGVGRFAYALVLPEMREALNWSLSEAGYFGSANTLGYFVGSLISHRVLYAVGYRRGVLLALLIQTLSLVLLYFGGHLFTLSIWRFVQGVMGAFIFVGGASILLANGGKGLAIGIYFAGVGLGIVASPSLLSFDFSWQQMWLFLAVLSIVFGLVSSWIFFRLLEPAPRISGKSASLTPITLPLIAYGLYGAGYIGYMTFVTTGLAVDLKLFWTILGIGSALNGLVWGAWVHRVRGSRALIDIFLVLSLSSLYPLLIHFPWVSAFFFGLSFLGVVTAITDMYRILLPEGAWGRAMALSTAAFAFGQFVGPTISGVAGDAFGGVQGALFMSSALLFTGLAVVLWSHFRLQRMKKVAI